MGGDGCDDDGSIGISSQNCKTDYGNDIEEGRRQGMRVCLGGCGIEGYKALENKGVREEAAEKLRSIYQEG